MDYYYGHIATNIDGEETFSEGRKSKGPYKSAEDLFFFTGVGKNVTVWFTVNS